MKKRSRDGLLASPTSLLVLTVSKKSLMHFRPSTMKDRETSAPLTKSGAMDGLATRRRLISCMILAETSLVSALLKAKVSRCLEWI